MGSMGGGAIRTASKVAGMTAATGGIRSITAERFPFSSAARKAASGRPAVATSDDMKLVVSNSESGVQKPCLEFDDWVFPSAEEEVKVANPMPRAVFGGVPSLQEAKEATSELSFALEKAFLSSPDSVGCESSVVADHGSSLSFSSRENLETKACITSEIVGVPTVPAPAIMAFKFLNESLVAKDVVASIACDPNVWDAVLQNQDLQKFLQAQSACVACTDENFSGEHDYDAKSFNGSSEYEEPEYGSRFRDFFRKMKSSVVDMLSNLSDYFKDLFGDKGTNTSAYFKDLLGDKGTNTRAAFMQQSFFGLVVMAILVILFKRA